MENYLIWMILTLFAWLALIIKNKPCKIYASIVLVLIGVFARILQFFVLNLLKYFLGITILNTIFGMFISAIVVLSFILVPLLLANKANEAKLMKWVYILFGYFLTAFALSFLTSFC
jgi:hypothetical protein